jgi:hypothetical protein
MGWRLLWSFALTIGVFVVLGIMKNRGMPFAARMVVPVGIAAAVLTWERWRKRPG